MALQRIIDYYVLIQESTDPLIIFSKTSILTLLIYFFFRYLLIGSIFKMLKKLDRDLNKSVLRNYSSYAWVGWLFFFIGLIIMNILSLNGTIILHFLGFVEWCLVIALSFFLSVYAHLYVLTKAIIVAFQHRHEIEKS